jgi:hypothetical protein
MLKMLLLTIMNACNLIRASKEAKEATQFIELYEGHNSFMKKVSSITAKNLATWRSEYGCK